MILMVSSNQVGKSPLVLTELQILLFIGIRKPYLVLLIIFVEFNNCPREPLAPLLAVDLKFPSNSLS